MGMYEYIFLDSAASPSRGNGLKGSLSGTVTQVVCSHAILSSMRMELSTPCITFLMPLASLPQPLDILQTPEILHANLVD